ncbi:hypothetical protein GF324_13695 [bacterium]|nr:hypothetical protein [bacterium]
MNLSFDPVNPAVKVELLKDGEVVDYAWAFHKMPYFKMGNREGPSSDYAFHLVSFDGLQTPGGAGKEGAE